MGKSSPSLTIPNDGYYGIAVDSKGDIFASATAGSVTAYRPGKKKPYETITGGDNFDGVAIDSKDNVWVADIGASKVYVIFAGTKKLKDAGISGINGPNGIAFGRKDVLYVANFGPTNVTVYRHGAKHPSMTITDGISRSHAQRRQRHRHLFPVESVRQCRGLREGRKETVLHDHRKRRPARNRGMAALSSRVTVACHVCA